MESKICLECRKESVVKNSNLCRECLEMDRYIEAIANRHCVNGGCL